MNTLVLMQALLSTASQSSQFNHGSDEQRTSTENFKENSTLLPDFANDSAHYASTAVERGTSGNRASSVTYSVEATKETTEWTLLNGTESLATVVDASMAELTTDAPGNAISGTSYLTDLHAISTERIVVSEVVALNVTDSVSRGIQLVSATNKPNGEVRSVSDTVPMPVSRSDDKNCTASSDGSTSPCTRAVTEETTSMLSTYGGSNEIDSLRNRVYSMTTSASLLLVSQEASEGTLFTPSATDLQRSNTGFSYSINQSESASFNTDPQTAGTTKGLWVQHLSTSSGHDNGRSSTVLKTASTSTRHVASQATIHGSKRTSSIKQRTPTKTNRPSIRPSIATSILIVISNLTTNLPEGDVSAARNFTGSVTEVGSAGDLSVAGDAATLSGATVIPEKPTHRGEKNLTISNDKEENSTQTMIFVAACVGGSVAAILITAVACAVHSRCCRRIRKKKLIRAHRAPRISLLWPRALHRGSQLVSGNDVIRESSQQPIEMVENDLYVTTFKDVSNNSQN